MLEARRPTISVQIPLFFSEADIGVTTYLDVLKNFVLPHLEQEYIEIFQHGDAVVPLSNFVRAALNGKFPVQREGVALFHGLLNPQI
jgi:hypothetical protein